MNLSNRLRSMGERVTHWKCTKGQVLEASMITARGIHARIAQLCTSDGMTVQEAHYLCMRLKELRELTKQLLRWKEYDHIRQLVRIRQKLWRQLDAAAEKQGIHIAALDADASEALHALLKEPADPEGPAGEELPRE